VLEGGVSRGEGARLIQVLLRVRGCLHRREVPVVRILATGERKVQIALLPHDCRERARRLSRIPLAFLAVERHRHPATLVALGGKSRLHLQVSGSQDDSRAHLVLLWRVADERRRGESRKLTVVAHGDPAAD